MLAFDPLDPFPLLPEKSHSYADAQAHSEEVDRWLGLRTAEIEARISGKRPEGQQLWIGLPIQAMLTPYTELREILAALAPPPGSTIVDLGAGYARLAFVLLRHYKEVRCVAYEYVAERVAEALRCLPMVDGCDESRCRILEQDLADPAFHPVPAEYYFLYDYGTRAAIEKTLRDLRRIARERAITVIGRGRASRDAIERAEPWLSSVVPPRHFAHYSIYRSGQS